MANGITLAQARDRVRLWSRLTSVDVLTPDLDYFIGAAEERVWIDVTAMNPSLVAASDVVVVPALTAKYALSPANLTALGAGRWVSRIALVTILAQASDPARWRVSATNALLEMTGSGERNDKAPYDVSTMHWLFDGANLRIYRPQGSDMTIEITYVRNCVPQTDITKPILSELNDAGDSARRLVCYRAAADLRGMRGLDNTWQQGKVVEEEGRLGLLRNLQSQEAEVAIGVRWPLAGPSPSF